MTTEIHASVFEQMTFDGEYSVIPDHMRESIMNYALHRYEPGNFLTSVICNDLRGAVFHADAENLPLIKTYVLWFYNCCPSFLVGKDNFLKHLSCSRKAGE
jgi:hypothetical protein